MRRFVKALGLPAILIAGLIAGAYCLRPHTGLAKIGSKRLLYLTMSAGFKHDVIPFSREIVKQIGEKSGAFETDFADDVTPFTAENLRNYDAVMFYTTGELPFTDVQKQILMEYLAAGHGFVGVHSATDTCYNWGAYGQMLGGYFDGHPWHQMVTVDVSDPDDKITKFLGKSFQLNDEIYQIDDFEAPSTRVLLHLDPLSVDRTKPGAHTRYYNWPLAWTRRWGRGRVFYNALGHEKAVWESDWFQQLMLNGIKWSMGDFKE